jgi:hypothetical protein
MRGTEALYGYVVALELVAVATMNLVIRTGKGAPAHPQTALQIAGLAAGLVLVGVLQTNNRMVVGFAAILGAFLVNLPKVPTSLAIPHLFALALPLAYALVLTSRQRKATAAHIKGRPSSRPKTAAERRADVEARRRQKRDKRSRAAGSVSGPAANRRYTPPKPKRGTQGHK